MQVIKRDGTIAQFNADKIIQAIDKAFTNTQEVPESTHLSETIAQDIQNLNTDLTVEKIQDLVEQALMANNCPKTAKAYILYRKQHEKARTADKTLFNYKKTMKDYLNVDDWRVKENSTVTYSIGGLILSNSGAMTANYWLDEIYDDEIANAHRNADIHIHDLSMLSGYCFTGDTEIETVNEGLVSFKELVERKVNCLMIYAYDFDSKKIISAAACCPRKTQTVTQLAKVTLTSGKEIMCTPDHLFLTQEEQYIKAKNLTPSIPLMGLTTNEKCISVEIIDVKPTDVYDLSVPGYHNFALASGVFVHNCAGWSLKQLIKEGLGGVQGKITSSPAKHLATLCNQMVNFIGILQNEWAGAQAFSSFDTYLAPFVKVDNLTYEQTKKCIESFIYGVNTPSRWGGQAPFSNITLDWTVPADLAYQPAIVGGKEMDFTYGDCKKEMDMVNKAFIEIMLNGDANGRGFQYPIPTYSITKDFDWSDTENNRLLFEMTGKYGTPYFSNYINSDMKPSDVRSMCPLTGDTLVLTKSASGIYATPILSVIRHSDNYNTLYQVWNGEKWVAAIPNRSEQQNIFEFTFSNNAQVSMGEHHIQPVWRNGVLADIEAKDLQVGDWVPFNKKQITTSNLGGYDVGYLVGAYLEIGSQYTPEKNIVIYNFGFETDDSEVFTRIQSLWTKLGYANKVIYNQSGKKLLKVYGDPYVFIRQYISGNTPLDRKPTSFCYNMSVEWLNGFRDGYKGACGTKQKDRCNTLSKNMADSLASLFSVLGERGYISEVDNSHVYTKKKSIYYLDFPATDKIENVYFEDENYRYFKVTRKMAVPNRALYCLEVADDSQLFMLANGLITHNCRLRLDLRELRKKGGGYFGSGENTGCYDEKTEILTATRGWIPFKKLTLKDKIYTRNLLGNLEIHHPTQLFKYPYEGSMYHFRNKDFDMLVTPNHKMVCENKKTHKQRFIRADEYISSTILGIPRKAINIQPNKKFFTAYSATKIPMDKWLEFIGRFIAVGSTNSKRNAEKYGYRVIIPQLEVEKVLKDLPFAYNRYGKTYIVTDKWLWTYCRQHIGKNNRKKHIPREFFNCSKTELDCLIKGLVSEGKIPSTDNIQELFVVAGHSCNPTTEDEFFDITPNDITVEYYQGNVYCCEVPNHTLMVRRNGKATWCGNSIGVVSLNMPRLGYLSKDENDFFTRLDYLMDISARSLDVKRKVITQFLKKGLYPYTQHYLGNFDDHFSTMGPVGMNEMCLNAKWIQKDLTHKEAQDFTEKVLIHMRERLSDYQEQYGNLYNLEAIPAESTSYRLARHDKEAFPDIITASKEGETPYYTNSSHLPVGFTEDVFRALDIQDKLQILYTSGTVFHVFIGEKLPDWKAVSGLVRAIAQNYQLPYYTISPTYSVCMEHGYLAGEQKICPFCQQPTEVYSRITGYYRPVQNWNDGKLQEYKDRRTYDINN